MSNHQTEQFYETALEAQQELYPDKCGQCGSPARWETVRGEIIGVEDYQFCINPACPNWDGWNLTERRRRLEDEIKDKPVYRRYRTRIWKSQLKPLALARKERRRTQAASRA